FRAAAVRGTGRAAVGVVVAGAVAEAVSAAADSVRVAASAAEDSKPAAGSNRARVRRNSREPFQFLLVRKLRSRARGCVTAMACARARALLVLGNPCSALPAAAIRGAQAQCCGRTIRRC